MCESLSMMSRASHEQAVLVGAVPWPVEPMASTHRAWIRRRGDEQFLEMLRIYRSSGGLVREDEVLRLCRERGARCEELLTRAQRDGRLIRFDWGNQVWLPMFQFNADMTPHPSAQAVFDELRPVFDGWELALWCAQPNGWLGLKRPVEVLTSDLPRLIEAARVDRFIAAG